MQIQGANPHSALGPRYGSRSCVCQSLLKSVIALDQIVPVAPGSSTRPNEVNTGPEFPAGNLWCSTNRHHARTCCQKSLHAATAGRMTSLPLSSLLRVLCTDGASIKRKKCKFSAQTSQLHSRAVSEHPTEETEVAICATTPARSEHDQACQSLTFPPLLNTRNASLTFCLEPPSWADRRSASRLTILRHHACHGLPIRQGL